MAVPGALRIGGVAGQPGPLGGRRVEERLVPGVVDDHQRGVRGRCCSASPASARAGRPAAAGPSRSRYAPSAPRSATSRWIAADDGVGVAHRDGPDVDHPVGQHDRLHQRMPVRLDESGHHAAVADVDDLACRARSAARCRHGCRPRRCGRRPRPAPRRWVASFVDGQHGSVDDKVSGRHGPSSRERTVASCKGSFPRAVSISGGCAVRRSAKEPRARWDGPLHRAEGDNDAVHADHAVHPEAEKADGRTSTSTRSSRQWAATTRS